MNRIPKALIDKEWLEHGGLITWWLALWAIGLFIIPLLTTPMILGIFCAVYAAWIAQRVGGSDVVQGTEETTFALPATRREILLSRLWITGIPLAIMVIGGIIALATGLPAFLWSLVVESGFTEWPVSSSLGTWMIWTIAPITIFAWTFHLSSGAKSRTQVNMVAFAALMMIGGLLMPGIPSPGFSSKETESVTLIFIASLLVGLSGIIVVSFRQYPSKEATINPDAPSAVGRWWVTAIVALVVVLLLLIVLLSTGEKFPNKPRPDPSPVPVKMKEAK